MKLHAAITGLLPLAVLAQPCASGETAADGPRRPASTSINQLIDDLDADSYDARETAMDQLKQSGAVSIPLLLKAAMSDSLETSWRAANLLGQFRHAPNVDMQDAALDALEQLLSVDHPIRARAGAYLPTSRYDRHHRAVVRLRELGGKVSHGDGRPTQVAIGAGWQGGRASLLNLRRLDRLESLQFQRARVSDEWLLAAPALPNLKRLVLIGTGVKGTFLTRLREFPKLTFLSLEGNQLEPRVLEHLSGAKHIEHLGLDDTNAKNDDLAYLSGLDELQTLWLNNTQVTDEGLAHLKRLDSLSKLILTGTAVAGPGLADLKDVQSLRFLSLQGVRLDDEHAAHLAGLEQIEALGLDATRITDEGLKHLAGMKNLKMLWLNGTPITDAGIVHLAKLTGLREIHLPGTQLMNLAELQAALPRCQIYH